MKGMSLVDSMMLLYVTPNDDIVIVDYGNNCTCACVVVLDNKLIINLLKVI